MSNDNLTESKVSNIPIFFHNAFLLYTWILFSRNSKSSAFLCLPFLREFLKNSIALVCFQKMFRPANQSDNRKENRWATSGKKIDIRQCPHSNFFLINLQAYFFTMIFLQSSYEQFFLVCIYNFLFQKQGKQCFPLSSLLS